MNESNIRNNVVIGNKPAVYVPREKSTSGSRRTFQRINYNNTPILNTLVNVDLEIKKWKMQSELCIVQPRTALISQTEKWALPTIRPAQNISETMTRPPLKSEQSCQPPTAESHRFSGAITRPHCTHTRASPENIDKKVDSSSTISRRI